MSRRRVAAALLPAASTSIRSTCEARTSNRSRPSSICEPIPTPAPMRSMCCCRTPTMSARWPISFARFRRSSMSRRCRTSCRQSRSRSSTLIAGSHGSSRRRSSPTPRGRPTMRDRRRVERRRRHAQRPAEQGERAGCGCGQASGRERSTKLADGDKAKRERPQTAFIGRCEIALDGAAGALQARAGDARKACRTTLTRNWVAGGRASAHRGDAEGRSQRQRDAAPIRARRAKVAARRDRRAGLDPGSPATRSSGLSSRRAPGR